MATDCRLIQGDALTRLREMDSGSVHICVTSPPYYALRDYGVKGQLGLEPSLDAYVARLVEVFREVRRVLRDDGLLWCNLGDSYGSGEVGRHDGGGPGRMMGKLLARQQRPATSHKNLLGVPWRVAFALQADGWILRSDIIWHKPNPMPESVQDRPTKSHEYVFLLAKQAAYYYDADAVREPARTPWHGVGGFRNGNLDNNWGPKEYRNDDCEKAGRNRRTVWTIPSQPFKGAHFATFPEKLVEPCILAGCPEGGLVLDPFSGAATVGVVCQRLGRRFVGIELNPAYIRMSRQRLKAAKAKQRQLAQAA